MKTAATKSPQNQSIQHRGQSVDPFVVCSPLVCRTHSSIKLLHEHEYEHEKDTATSATSHLTGINDDSNLVNVNPTPEIFDSIEMEILDFMSSNMAESGEQEQVRQEVPLALNPTPYPTQGNRPKEGRAGIGTRSRSQPSQKHDKVWEDNNPPSAAAKAISGAHVRKQAPIVTPHPPRGTESFEVEGIKTKDTSLSSLPTESSSNNVPLDGNVFFFHKLKRNKKKRGPASSVAVVSPPKRNRSVSSAKSPLSDPNISNSIQPSRSLSHFDWRKQCLDESQSLLELYMKSDYCKVDTTHDYMPIRVDPERMYQRRAKRLTYAPPFTSTIASPSVGAAPADATFDGSICISRLSQILADISTPGHVMSIAEFTSALNAVQEVQSQLLAAVRPGGTLPFVQVSPPVQRMA